ncbi:MAG TPA: hypothetical protein VN611_12170 [Patescibacteria group bacterium]|nr:hypothetical protein [Patescibacteria group bacterium]
MYVSIYDVGLFIVFVMVLAIGFYLIAALKIIKRVMTQTSDVICANQKTFEIAHEVLPELMVNSSKMVQGALKMLESANSAVADVESSVVGNADKLQETIEMALVYAHYAAEMAKGVVGVFSNNGKK